MFIVNVEAAIHNEGKWLIIERSQKEEHAGGMLSLVGGKVEKENNAVDILERTIKREVLEEVDVEIRNLKYLQSTSFVTNLDDQVINIVFLCEYKSSVAYPKSPEEVEEIKWMTSDEIYRHHNAPIYLKESIKQAEIKLATM